MKKPDIRAVIDEAVAFALESTSEATLRALLGMYLRMACIAILPCTIALFITSLTALQKNPAAVVLINMYYGLTFGIYGAGIIMWLNGALTMVNQVVTFWRTLMVDFKAIWGALKILTLAVMFVSGAATVPLIFEVLVPDGSLRGNSPNRVETIFVSACVWASLAAAIAIIAWSDRVPWQKTEK